MQLYMYIGLITLASGTWGLYQMFIKGRSPIRSRKRDIQAKNPLLVKRFYTIKHAMNLCIGLFILFTISRLKTPKMMALLIMAICISMALESLSIYITHKNV